MSTIENPAAGQPDDGDQRDERDERAGQDTGRDQELEQLRAELAQARHERARADEDREQQVNQAVARALAQQRGERPDKARVSVDLSGMSQSDRRERYAEWPTRGGSELPQPWDLRAQGLHGEMRDFERDTQPGEPNTVSPIVVEHGLPILAVGSADPAVHTIGRVLGRLGFPNSVSEGTNAWGAVDNTLMAAVHAFRDAYGVQEDPSAWGGDTPDGRARAAAHIGPYTIEAILRAGQRELEHA